MAIWNRFDIAYAYQALENDWNHGGWLRERPSNQRRMESIGVQLHRIQFSAGMMGGSFGALVEAGEEMENAVEIYIEALVRFGMGPMVAADDEIAEYVTAEYMPSYVAENFPQLISTQGKA